MLPGPQTSNETSGDVRGGLQNKDYWFNSLMFEIALLYWLNNIYIDTAIDIQKRLYEMIKPGSAHHSNTFETKQRSEVTNIFIFLSDMKFTFWSNFLLQISDVHLYSPPKSTSHRSTAYAADKTRNLFSYAEPG